MLAGQETETSGLREEDTGTREEWRGDGGRFATLRGKNGGAEDSWTGITCDFSRASSQIRQREADRWTCFWGTRKVRGAGE